ncbi:MAG: ribokinase [Oscillospiraceae bacterium]|jgi:ribokinase|nr:ribokinase [Oscillospiraceae bacterium]
MQEVMVFGSFLVDLMGRAPHLPVPGETVKGSFFKQGAGGKGFNQAVAAHKAGAKVWMVTKLGRDSLADVALAVMDELGMPKDCLFYNDTVSTGIALILVDEGTAQNEIVIVPGACSTITPADIGAIAPHLRQCAYVLLQLEINQDANEAVAKLAKENGVRVIVNTAPYQQISDEFLRGVWLVTPNEVEAQALTGIAVRDLPSARAAAAVFFEKGVENVLITLGEKGVFVSGGGKEALIPAFRVEAVDTTGAGDAFNGGLLTALADGKDLFEAAHFANALGALSVQKIGATPSMPTRAEIDAFTAQQGILSK